MKSVFKALIAILIIAWLCLNVSAQNLQPIPPLSAQVIDMTGTLDAAQTAELEAKLASLEADKGAQLVILMVPTTAPEDIASYANRVGNTWKIGRTNVGDGLLFLVALGDRRVRIEVAKTLEGAVPDIAAKHIIDETITPYFRRGDFAGGINSAIDQLSALVRGEPLPPVTNLETARADEPDFGIVEIAVFLFIALPIFATVARGILGRKLGAVVTGVGAGTLAFFVTASIVLTVGAGLFALFYALISSVFAGLPGARPRGGNGGLIFGPPSSHDWGRGDFGSGGFGGGFSGGSFGSGGGGDFGGGGASGRW